MVKTRKEFDPDRKGIDAAKYFMKRNGGWVIVCYPSDAFSREATHVFWYDENYTKERICMELNPCKFKEIFC